MTKLSVVLPVYNERNNIEIVVKEWKEKLDKLKIEHELIICEDGSTDGTSEFLRQIKNRYSLILNQAQKRRSYGGAVIDGIKSAKCKHILCVDSDGQCDPNDFSKFWKNRNKADIIIGWREKRADSFQRKVYSNLFKIIFKLLFPVKIHDPSAPFVLFQKQSVLKLDKHLKFLKEGFWWGFIAASYKLNFTICEISVSHRKRLSGQTVVYQFQKIPSIAVRNLIGLIKLKIKTVTQ
jgi:glycosyltransferase involved in cell wall biosynthesis